MSIRILALTIVVGLSTVGCAFTQRTDRLFLGTTGGSPVYADRTAAGLVLVPFAIAADLITFPVQAVVVVAGGDRILYSHAGPKEGLARVDPRAQRTLLDMHDAMGEAATPVLVGVDAQGEVRPLDVTPAQTEAVIARMKRASETGAGRL